MPPTHITPPPTSHRRPSPGPLSVERPPPPPVRTTPRATDTALPVTAAPHRNPPRTYRPPHSSPPPPAPPSGHADTTDATHRCAHRPRPSRQPPFILCATAGSTVRSACRRLQALSACLGFLPPTPPCTRPTEPAALSPARLHTHTPHHNSAPRTPSTPPAAHRGAPLWTLRLWSNAPHPSPPSRQPYLYPTRQRPPPTRPQPRRLLSQPGPLPPASLDPPHAYTP